jgi:lactate dehydrogenase-like 2-hydroxyacid dehydrogenase
VPPDSPLLLARYAFTSERFRPIEEAFDVVVCDGPVLERATVEQLERAVCIWTFGETIDDALLDRMPALRIVVNHGVGYDAVDVDALARRGIAFVLPAGANAEAVADHTFALLLAVLHRVVENDALVRSGGWARSDYLPPMGRDAYGLRLGIIGLGAIGQAVARRARGFAMEVRYATPRRHPPSAEEAHGVAYADLDDLLGWADAVTLHCPLTDETRGLLDARRLDLLRPGAVLVNTARGALVEQTALGERLAGGRLGGAGLDVFDGEPDVPPALAALPNVVLSPHIADATPGAEEALLAATVDEVLRWVARG